MTLSLFFLRASLPGPVNAVPYGPEKDGASEPVKDSAQLPLGPDRESLR
jgi:hypothetical protein